jgi:hypothetical protein
MPKLLHALLVLAAVLVAAAPVAAKEVGAASCLLANPDQDVFINTECPVPIGTTLGFRHVHIVNNGKLIFQDGAGETTFWARAILVQAGGSLTAGTRTEPFGSKGGKLTIKLWGAPQPGNHDITSPDSVGSDGVPCKTFNTATKTWVDDPNCGVPNEIWTNSGSNPAGAKKVSELAINVRGAYPGPVDDYFYPYHPLAHDEKDHHAYFGYKVLAVSYGGKLQLFGKKGAIYNEIAADTACNPTGPNSARSTGRSWVRLAHDATPSATTNKAGGTKIRIESPKCGLDWASGDEIVITTTDYLPGHSELRKIQGAPVSLGGGIHEITLDKALTYDHHDTRFALDSTTRKGIDRIGLDAELTANGAEIRGTVGLLTRSIRIVSAGSKLNEELPAETDAKCTSGAPPDTNECYFGGHTIVRQGFDTVQIQGVEFFQLGQGGRIAHYPKHFHHARKTAGTRGNGQARPETYVMDSSIWDSMTRWVVLHGTHDVTVARNVGYRSIGHGFYLEDGTEINNKLLGNLGAYARAAVETAETSGGNVINVTVQRDNPRRVPGILVAKNADTRETPLVVPWRTDADQPTAFWIMNGWNDFQYNHAAGAGACGVCYWLVPGYNSTGSKDQKWESYASMQSNFDRGGSTPLKSFIGNSCTSAMMSFLTISTNSTCLGVGTHVGPDTAFLKPIANPIAGAQPADPGKLQDPTALRYFPSVTGGNRHATLGDVDFDGKALSFCGPNNPSNPNADLHDCSAKPAFCGDVKNPACAPTILDHFTTQFHWAESNFAALMLRNQWYLVRNSVITDVQNGGLNFVTGGGYTAADRLPGLWQLAYKSVFIGQTQPNNKFALDGGPFNPAGLKCDSAANATGHCLSLAEGVSFMRSNYGVGQRLLSFYDGPAVQESNAFLDINVRKLGDCTPQLNKVNCPENDPRPECNPQCPLNPDPNGVCTSKPACPQCSGTGCFFADAEKKKLVCAMTSGGECSPTSLWVSGIVTGLPKGYEDPEKLTGPFCYLPNAAIAWKQPNGFYYPPAFRSRRLYFDNVDIRHFVFEPLFKEGSFDTDVEQATKLYCKWSLPFFENFTSNDRQTTLLDEDGTLTGLVSSAAGDATTTIVNLDPFLASPVEQIECLSDRTSRVSPFQYMTTVVFPDTVGADWGTDCTSPICHGIPMFRQDILPSFDTENGTKPLVAKSLRLMGQDTGQRSSVTVNHGTYYLDTAVSEAQQRNGCIRGACNFINLFKPNETYYLFTIYAKKTTKQTYEVYVGKGWTTQQFDITGGGNVWLIQADIATKRPNFKRVRAFTSTEAQYDGTSGILTVTLDHASAKPNFAKAAKESCSPQSFCHYVGNEGENDPVGECRGVRSAADDDVCRWSIIDLDCPSGGCFGFGFKLPGGFVADGVDHRPQHPDDLTKRCLPNAAPWNLSLTEHADGTCPQAKDKVTDDFCK